MRVTYEFIPTLEVTELVRKAAKVVSSAGLHTACPLTAAVPRLEDVLRRGMAI
jgi:hypothetical protein